MRYLNTCHDPFPALLMHKPAAYIICTSPRSGSTLLCDLLTSTGVAGRAKSYFHQPSLSAWCAYFDLPNDSDATQIETLNRVFETARMAGRGDTDIFGLRLQRGSFDYFQTQLTLLWPEVQGDKARVEAVFGSTRFIHLTRTDKVDQAVSYIKAQQTGLWHIAPDGREIERLSAPQEPVYDPEAIAEAVQEFTGFDQEWMTWFERAGIVPMRVEYTTLASDPVGVLRELLKDLGLDPAAADRVEPGVAKLADEVSRTWRSRFLGETGGTI